MNEMHTNTELLGLWEEFLQKGDVDIVAGIYGKLYGKLFLFAMALTQCKEDAEDLIQDAFKQLVEGKSAEISHLEGWLKRSIKFAWKARIRDISNRKRILNSYKKLKLQQALIHTSIDVDKFLELIEDTLNQVNAEIIFLTIQGYSNEEIAHKLNLVNNKLNLTEKKVRNRKSESRKKIRALIGEEQFIIL